MWENCARVDIHAVQNCRTQWDMALVYTVQAVSWYENAKKNNKKWQKQQKHDSTNGYCCLCTFYSMLNLTIPWNRMFGTTYNSFGLVNYSSISFSFTFLFFQQKKKHVPAMFCCECYVTHLLLQSFSSYCCTRKFFFRHFEIETTTKKIRCTRHRINIARKKMPRAEKRIVQIL